jgi:hypothetical protein
MTNYILHTQYGMEKFLPYFSTFNPGHQTRPWIHQLKNPVANIVGARLKIKYHSELPYATGTGAIPIA